MDRFGIRVLMLVMLGATLGIGSAHAEDEEIIESLEVDPNDGVALLQAPSGFFYANLTDAEFLKTKQLGDMTLILKFQTANKVPATDVYTRVYDADGVKLLGVYCVKPVLSLQLKPGDYNFIFTDWNKNQKVMPLSIKSAARRTMIITWPPATSPQPSP